MNPMRPLVLLAALLLAATPATAGGHDFTGKCSSCHLSDPRGGTVLFTVGVDSLCRECHPPLQSHAHPSDVVPTMKLPPGFWVDASRRLTCAACHDPHPDAGAQAPALLRGNADDTGFCRLCHPEAVTAEGRHLAASFVAHPKRYTAPGNNPSPERLDALSSVCMECHGGAGGPSTMFCTLGTKGNCTGHVLGVVYDEAASRHDFLQPRASLPDGISLYEGKVGCLSCHSLYSQAPKLLSATPLCTSCHKMKR
jgi:predicted CXXCH cytochrome family protein